MMGHSTILGAILPAGVSIVEQIGALSGQLMPEEKRDLGEVVDSRRREFAAGRTCARKAISQLGLSAAVIRRGPAREPIWPTGLCGSITHCRSYCAAAVALTAHVWSIGIDADVDEPISADVFRAVLAPGEREAMADLPAGYNWDKLIFSAKESVYKMWFPITGQWLGFQDVKINIDPERKTFEVRFLRHPSDIHWTNNVLLGRFRMWNHLVLTSVCLSRH